jgi:hypothetical protein
MSKHKFSLPWPITIILLLVLLGFLWFALSFVLSLNRIFTSTGLPSPMATFVSNKFHISIDYPQTWVAYELTQGNHGDNEVIAFIGYAGPAAQPKVFIAQRSFPQPILDDVVAWGETRLMAKSSQYVTVKLDTITSPNDTALLRHYSVFSTTPLGQFTEKCMDWYTIGDSTGYQLSFCAHENHWLEMEGVFIQMAQSFKVVQ